MKDHTPLSQSACKSCISCKSLGSLIGTEGIKCRKDLAHDSYCTFESILKNKLISESVRNTAIKACIESFFFYNSRTMDLTLTKTPASSIDSFHSRILRILIHVTRPRIITNVDLYKRTKVTSWRLRICKRRLSWFRHLLCSFLKPLLNNSLKPSLKLGRKQQDNQNLAAQHNPKGHKQILGNKVTWSHWKASKYLKRYVLIIKPRQRQFTAKCPPRWWKCNDDECLVQKNQNFELNWNLIHRLIRIFKIQWWHWLSSVFDQKIPLLGKLGPKNQICQLSCDSVPKLIPTDRIKWKCSLFLFLTWNTLFEEIWSKKSKLSLQAKIDT